MRTDTIVTSGRPPLDGDPPAHLVLGLLAQRDDLAAQVLADLDVTADTVR